MHEVLVNCMFKLPAIPIYITFYPENCLLGHQRTSLFGHYILVQVLKFNVRFTNYSQLYQNTDKRSRLRVLVNPL